MLQVSGTPGFIDPLLINSGKPDVLSDGFGIGITLLMALTGLPPLDILPSCRLMMREPKEPNVCYWHLNFE